MKPKKEKRNLDERIRSAIGTEEVTFDFDKWKAGHQNQIEQFKASVSSESAEPAQLSTWLIIAKSRFTKFAAAAVIIIGVGFFIRFNPPAEQIDDTAVVAVGKTPAQMVSLASLNLAYRRGGMEAVDKQYEKAFKRTGPRPVKLTIEDLFAELNGG